MPYIWFWVHWLVEHTSKFVKFEFTKLISADCILKLIFVSRRQVLVKTKKHYPTWKTGENDLCFILGALVAEHALKYVEYRFIKFGRLTGSDPKDVAKIIFQLLFSTLRRVLIKNQRLLPNEEHWWKCLIFDSGCTGWKSMPQNLLKIKLPNLIGWLQQSLMKEQKLSWSSCFYLEGKLSDKKQKTLWKEEKEQQCLICDFRCIDWAYLPEHAPISTKFQFTKFGRLTPRGLSEQGKIFWSYAF